MSGSFWFLMMTMVGGIIGAGIFIAINEFKSWNGGICRRSGNKWKRAHTGKNGFRYYQSGPYYTCISMPRIDRNYDDKLD